MKNAPSGFCVDLVWYVLEAGTAYVAIPSQGGRIPARAESVIAHG